RCFFFFSSRRRHTRFSRDWSSDVCSSDLESRLVRLETGTYRIGASETRSALRQLADGRAAVVDTVDAQLKMTLDGAVAVEICRRSEERRVGKEGRYRGARDE